jgi:hypothetical protein
MPQTCFAPTSSTNINCEGAISGLQAISVGKFDSTKKIATTVTGVVTVAASFAANSLGRLEVKDVANVLTETVTQISGGGLASVAGSLAVVIKVGKTNELRCASDVMNYLKGQLVIFLESKGDVVTAFGSQSGAECLSVVYTSGDGAGNKMYTVTFSTMEYTLSEQYLLTAPAVIEYKAAIKAVT